VNAIHTEGQEFINHFKRFLIGYETDGVPVFTGQSNSVWTRRVSYVGRNVWPVHCMSHRLHLILRHAIDGHIPESQAIQSFQKDFRDIYSFIQKKQGQTNRAFIQTFCEELMYVLYRISKLFEGRWALSEYNVVSKILKSWEGVVNSLQEYVDDTENTFSQTASAFNCLSLN